MNEFIMAKEILSGVKDAEECHRRDLLAECDWNDPLDRSYHLSTKRSADRLKLIRKLAPKSVCPHCGNSIMSSRSWVISKDEKNICCRGCYFSGVHTRYDSGSIHIERRVFGKLCPRVEIDGFQLAAIRDEIDFKSSAFARAAGWSNVYQHKLENSIKSVPLEVAETILQVLDERKVTTKDCL